MAEYTTREMMEAYDQTPPVRSFLQKTFFPHEQTHVTEKVEFDVRKGKRVMAPFVSKRKAGKVISRQGWKTNQFSTPSCKRPDGSGRVYRQKKRMDVQTDSF